MEKICDCHHIPKIWCAFSKCPDYLSKSSNKFVKLYRCTEPNGIKQLNHHDFIGTRIKKRGTIRFVVISDTHNRSDIQTHIPSGDVLLHCGDLTLRSFKKEYIEFNKWIGSLPHPYKIVIAGNHDRTLEIRPLNSFFATIGAADKKELLDEFTNFTYIEDESINVHGYTIYGSPWTPVHLGGFQKQRGASIHAYWKKIPTNTDILLTHGPPAGIGDLTRRGDNAGCVNLLHEIQTRVKPLYHGFGHIHEGNGVYTDGATTFINAALCDLSYKAKQPAYVFDLPTKTENSEENGLNGVEFGNLNIDVSAVKSDDES